MKTEISYSFYSEDKKYQLYYDKFYGIADVRSQFFYHVDFQNRQELGYCWWELFEVRRYH